MDNLYAFTTDQLKTLYNTRLAEARRHTEEALKVREVIEDRHEQFRGRSKRMLTEAIRSLFGARTFANTPNDLASSENPHRG